MTTFKDVLNGKRKSPAAIFHKFRVDGSIHTRRHVFVEGYDDVGYYARHAALDGEEQAKFHLCFGKKNLDAVASLYWKSGLKNSLVYFIRDSDFDVFMERAPTGENLFLTCGYAVENYVCSAEAVDAYLRIVFCLDEEELDVRKIVNEYVDLAQEFHIWLAPLYGAVMIATANGRSIDMNKLNVGDHFETLLVKGDLPNQAQLPELALMGLDASDFTEYSKSLGEKFGALPALLWMRGKYLLKALTAYLRNKEIEIRKLYKSGNITQFNRNAASRLNEIDVFDRLSGLARPPARLLGFFQEKV